MTWVPYTPVEIPRFAGLNITDDPQQVGLGGAIDLSNFILTPKGTLRVRGGYQKFTAVAASGAFNCLAYDGTYVFGGTAATTTNVRAYSASTLITSANYGGTAVDTISATRAGTASTAYSYVGVYGSGGAGTSALYRFNGTTFTDVTATVSPATAGGLVAYNAVTGRLVMAHPGDSESRVWFSNAGTPETFSANNFVRLAPNDGARPTAIVYWREKTFVFKDDKFFVFTGESTISTGDPEFNFYSVVTNGGGVPSQRCVSVGRDGIYFVNNYGVWVTTGGPPQKLSKAVDPLFTGDVPATFTSSAKVGLVTKLSAAYLDGHVFAGFEDNNSAPRVLWLSADTGEWTLHSMAATGVCAQDAKTSARSARLLFGYTSGGNHIGSFPPYVFSNLTDDGTTINALYRTGFGDLGQPGVEKTVREWLMDATPGDVSLSVAVNDGALGTATTLSFSGVNPSQKRDRRAVRGRNFSLRMQATADVSGLAVSRVVANVREQRLAGMKAT